MIGKVIQQFSRFQSNLTLKLKQNIVVRYQPRKSIFDFTHYNQYWIPKQRTYHKQRKPPQPQWKDTNIVYPQLIPSLYPKNWQKHYVKNVIQKQEIQRSLRSKQYLLQELRAGDLVDITYQDTFQSDQKVTYRALVLGFRRKNSLSAALEVCIRLGGMNLKAIYLIHSPKVVNIKIVGMGSGNFRANIKHNWQKLSKSQLNNPKLRKRVMKNRWGLIQRKVKRTAISGIKFDHTKTDSIKRIIQDNL